MTTRRPARAGTAVVALVASLAACATGPSQEELVATSDEARAKVQDIVQEAVDAFAELNPDLTLTVEYLPEIDDHWSDCSSATAPDPDNPKAIVWVTGRWIVVEPKVPTAELLDPVIAELVAGGWGTGSESTT